MSNVSPQLRAASLLFALILLPQQQFASASPVSPQESLGQPIKVMSFNIRFGAANDGDNRWPKRKSLVEETIAVFSPDLLGVQEALDFQTEFLSNQLTDYSFFGRSREKDGRQGEFCGIYYRKQRFTKLAGGHFWLSQTPNDPGSKSWDSSLPRMVSWVKLADKESAGREFIFANTHFDHRGQIAREESAQVIRQQIVSKYPQTPVILVGDFNSAENSDPYQTIIGKNSNRPLIDSYRVCHPTPSPHEGTFSAWVGKQTGSRIDWILHTEEVKTNLAAINRYQQLGRYPSDHFPVQAVVKIELGKQEQPKAASDRR